MEAFVYCWTDHKTNKLYVGSHKGSIDDDYVCSSKLMLEEYKKRPEDFTRQIIAKGSYKDMISFETVILKSVNAKIDEQFYNMHNGDGKFYLAEGHTEESKIKISKSKKGYRHTNETKDKISKSRLNKEPWNKGKKGLQKSTRKGIPRSEAEKVKMSENRKGIEAWNKNITKEKSTFYGKTHTEESVKRMSEARKLYWAKRKGLI